MTSQVRLVVPINGTVELEQAEPREANGRLRDVAGYRDVGCVDRIGREHAGCSFSLTKCCPRWRAHWPEARPRLGDRNQIGRT